MTESFERFDRAERCMSEVGLSIIPHRTRKQKGPRYPKEFIAKAYDAQFELRLRRVQFMKHIAAAIETWWSSLPGTCSQTDILSGILGEALVRLMCAMEDCRTPEEARGTLQWIAALIRHDMLHDPQLYTDHGAVTCYMEAI